MLYMSVVSITMNFTMYRYPTFDFNSENNTWDFRSITGSQCLEKNRILFKLTVIVV
jgi:hypothetical protein